MLTDSGGFQVWSSKRTGKIMPAGVGFGAISTVPLFPRKADERGTEIGADIIMALTPTPLRHVRAKRNIPWNTRCAGHAWRSEYLADHPPSPWLRTKFLCDCPGRNAQGTASVRSDARGTRTGRIRAGRTFVGEPVGRCTKSRTTAPDFMPKDHALRDGRRDAGTCSALILRGIDVRLR